MIQETISISAQEISELVDGRLSGDPTQKVSRVTAIQREIPDTLTFCSDLKYEKFISGSSKRVILVKHDIKLRRPSHITYIAVPDVYQALSHILDHIKGEVGPRDIAVSERAVIHDSARIEEDVAIGHFSIVGRYVHLGAQSTIHDQVSIGDNVSIGERCVIHSGVQILEGVQIGSDVVIHPNTVIGGDGFGYTESGGGYKRLPHIGTVVIEDRVEIGANCCIDRGMIEDTIIKTGAKLDNLIHIAHGAEIGKHVAIAAQSGISGSSKVGEYSQLGGQVGVIGHVTIAPGSKIQAQSGVAGDIKEPKKKWYGYPSIPYYQYLRSFAIFKRLPELLQRLQKLEKNQDQN